MTKRYRIGLIGAGARGETFARNLQAGGSRATLFGVCDADDARLAQFCDHCDLRDTPRYTDTASFLAEPELDAVVITTPDFTHADLATAAMYAGKHIYLEKPLAHTIEDGYRILRAQQETGVTAMVGFNMRESIAHRKLKEVLDSGVLGKLVHIAGLEQLNQWHGASFMRRWHRRSDRSGGLLNHKCSHDLDLMMWMLGHRHRVRRIASFGGGNVFLHAKQPATHCHLCPEDTRNACPYRHTTGYMFPVGAPPAHKVKDAEVYGNDLCVYNDDKDIVDNQTVLLEWDNGVRGSFNLQLFQHAGLREMRVWGEMGFAELRTAPVPFVRVTDSRTGDTTEHRFEPRAGGHGGSDAKMMGRFIELMEHPGRGDSGLSQGLAATVVAIKADEARLTGSVVELPASIFDVPAPAPAFA